MGLMVMCVFFPVIQHIPSRWTAKINVTAVKRFTYKYWKLHKKTECKENELQVSVAALEDSSTAAMESGLSVDAYCHDDCNIVSSIITIKSEEHPESKREDNVSSQQRYVLNFHVASEESVKCEAQSPELDAREIILPFQNTD